MKKLTLVGILFLTLCTSVGIAGVPCAILPAPAAWSMIANPCDGGVTAISVFLPAAPEGTMVYKLNGAGWDLEIYVDGAWEPGVMALSPGQGAWIDLPVAAALAFEGVPLVSPQAIALPAGYSICSPPAGLGMAGFPIAEGDNVFKFNAASGGYDYYGYFDGAWEPAEPVIGVGEAFWVFKLLPALWAQ